MQNPEVTEPAGAGDVPTANYKMIGALAVKKGQLEKESFLNSLRKLGTLDLRQHKDIYHQVFHK